MVAQFLFLTYAVISMFLGPGVQQWLGIYMGNVGILANSHSYALPFLLMACVAKWEKIEIKQIELMFIFVQIGFMAFLTAIGKTAGFSFFLNGVIEPILIIAFLRAESQDCLKRLSFIIIAFFLIECSIATYEVITQTIVFAKQVDPEDMINWEGMRAYSICGHPLQNAFVISILTIVFVVSPNISVVFKVLLYFIGLIAVFACNARAATIAMILIGGFLFIKDVFKLKSEGVVSRIVVFALAVILLYYMEKVISKYSIGNRFFEIKIDKNDGSSRARFVLIDVLSTLSLSEWLSGISYSSKIILKKYHLVAIENSFVGIVLSYGLPFLISFYSFWFVLLKRLCEYAKYFWPIVLVYVYFLNINNTVFAYMPIMSITVFSLIAFLKNQKKQSASRSKTNRSVGL